MSFFMKFSIITPSFRSSKWLKLCIASVADQEGVEFEHIVQDSCSDDGTLDWLQKDSRVKAFIEKDNGMYDAVNRGLRRANGDILAYLNCDEQYLPGALRAVHEFFEQHPHVEVALAGTIVVDSEGNYICHRSSLLPVLSTLWFRFPVLTSSVFFRRSVIEKKNIFFDSRWKYLGDVHWFIALKHNKVRMAVENCYTSVFVDSGENMIFRPDAITEQNISRSIAPEWAKKTRWLLITLQRIKRFWIGHFFNSRQRNYAIYTLKSPESREMFKVSKFTTIWWNRLNWQNPILLDNKIVRTFFNLLPDKIFTHVQYFINMRQFLNLRSPKTFNEKIQWLKLNYKNELMRVCADKFTVRKYVAETIGEKYLIPLLGIYQSTKEINFNSLPDKFVLKVSHGSGWNIICKSKKVFNEIEALKKLNSWVKRDFYAMGREWAYKGLIPSIVCEEYLTGENDEPPSDYKFFCFKGKPEFLQVDFDRYIKHTRLLYDCGWNKIPCGLEFPVNLKDHPKPACLEEMLSVAASLAKPFPFVRVDLYEVRNKVYFGEMSFYPGKGAEKFDPPEYDLNFGQLLQIDQFVVSKGGSVEILRNYCKSISSSPSKGGRVYDLEILRDADFDRIKDSIRGWLPAFRCRKIFIKPNWVIHQQKPDFPISAMVISVSLIDATIECCLSRYPDVESIIVGDVPLQSCDWESLARQAGINTLIEKYSGMQRPVIRFLDLRRERFKIEKGYMVSSNNNNCDPKGYVEIDLGSESFLEEISKQAKNFRVSDYDPKETVSVHTKGRHKYLICKSILDCDLFINMPKMKTHQKAGITGALKNLVGINGEKAYLVHHRKGKNTQGGDEFPDDVSPLIILQTRLREIVQKRSKFIFNLLKIPWEILKKITEMQTAGTRENLIRSNLYTGSGSWYGNDTIWRMIYDLNMIILFGEIKSGVLSPKKQREYLSILDGVVSGEGNGPLQSLLVESKIVAISRNPFIIDFAIAQMMGFDWLKIPQLRNKGLFKYAEWGQFDPYVFTVQINSESYDNGLKCVPIIKQYLPSPGWKGHIEKEPGISEN